MKNSEESQNLIDASEQRMQAYIKQVREEGNKDMERHIGALSEEFKSRAQGIGELVLGHGEKLDIFGGKLDALEVAVTALQTNVEVLKDDVSVLKKDVKEIQLILNTKADQIYAVSLDKRLTTLESEKK